MLNNQTTMKHAQTFSRTILRPKPVRPLNIVAQRVLPNTRYLNSNFRQISVLPANNKQADDDCDSICKEFQDLVIVENELNLRNSMSANMRNSQTFLQHKVTADYNRWSYPFSENRGGVPKRPINPMVNDKIFKDATDSEDFIDNETNSSIDSERSSNT